MYYKIYEKIYIMVFWQNYNGFMLIFFAYAESVTSKRYEIKKRLWKSVKYRQNYTQVRFAYCFFGGHFEWRHNMISSAVRVCTWTCLMCQIACNKEMPSNHLFITLAALGWLTIFFKQIQNKLFVRMGGDYYCRKNLFYHGKKRKTLFIYQCKMHIRLSWNVEHLR